MRILRYIALSTASLIVVAFVGLVIADQWVKAHMFYPGLQNESAFLRTYESQSVIKPFIADGYPPSIGSGSGAGAGMKFVTHSANFDEFFTVRTDREAPLMTAVNSDIARRLVQSGALIVAQTGNYSAGFHFDYATANTVGSVSVKPLELAAVHRNSPLPDQLADVALKIDVSEQWYPNGPPLGTFASVASSR